MTIANASDWIHKHSKFWLLTPRKTYVLAECLLPDLELETTVFKATNWRLGSKEKGES